MQFKWVPITYAKEIQMSTHNILHYKEVDKKYTGYNLKTKELLDCALIGLFVVNTGRLDTVIQKKVYKNIFLALYIVAYKFLRELDTVHM